MEERFLYHIWDEGHLQFELRTESGKNIKIHYQGQYNTGRGPDFKNAIISVGDQELKGDVEIHLKSTDWNAHNHHEDRYFNNVILHVVLEHNGAYPQTIKEDGKACEILNLKHQLSEDISKLWQAHDKNKTPAVYCDLLSAIDNDRLTSILHLAGIRRFEGKKKRFNAALSLSSFDQILYEGIFEALGYVKNKYNTMQIAQSLPIKEIRRFKSEGLSKSQLCAIYLCSFGLLAKAPHVLKDEVQSELWHNFELQRWYAQKQYIDWQLFRVRPQNHPSLRIIYISDLIWQYCDTGLINAFICDIDQEADLYKEFKKLWAPRKTLDSMPALKLGKGVQDNIYLNIYLPIICLWQEKMGQATDGYYQAFRELPPLQDNHITRFMERYLNPSQLKLAKSKAIYQQGLMDIYHRFCDWHSCAECLQRHKSTG